MNYSDEQLIEKFIRTIEVKPANTKKLFAIGFIGLTGSGKSFVAQKISQKLNLYIASNDRIRRFFNELGYAGESPLQETLQKIAESCTRYLYQHKISHIIDADLILFHELALMHAQDFNARIYIIHITCPEEIIFQRLKKRAEEIQADNSANLSRAGENKYFTRKKLHASLAFPKFFYTIDTAGEIDEQIDDLILKLKNENAI
jgi:dephospho-CoA kinase